MSLSSKWVRRSLPMFAIAAAAFATPARAQSPASPAADTASYLSAGMSMETIRVTAAAPKSRMAYERSLIAGNRLLAKELKKYDRKIIELEQRLDSLRIAAAHKWRDAREMESAAQEARERRIEMERRLASLEAGTARVSRATTGPR